jgi:hypothetical protein
MCKKILTTINWNMVIAVRWLSDQPVKQCLLDLLVNTRLDSFTCRPNNFAIVETAVTCCGVDRSYLLHIPCLRKELIDPELGNLVLGSCLGLELDNVLLDT